MKMVTRRVARLFLPLARLVWAAIPASIQRRHKPWLQKVWAALGLGQWAKRTDPLAKLAKQYHPAVPLPIAFPSVPSTRGPAMPPEPSVTVVITAHDDGPFIDVALESVRRQDISDWECVVIDDASVDNTTAVVLRHAEEDCRISLVRRDRNVGLAAARNTGIALAKGEFVTFLDADDYMFPRTLGARLAAAQSSVERIAGSWCDWVLVGETAGIESVPPNPRNFETINYLSGGGENQVISTCQMIRRSVLVSLGGYDDDFRTAEDFEFATRLFRNGFQLAYAPVVGVAYRQKRISMIAGDPLGHARNAMRVYDYMSRQLAPLAQSTLATAPFVEPPRGIPSPVKRIERLITFMTLAVLSDNDGQLNGMYELLPADIFGPLTSFVDVDGRIDTALLRHSRRFGEMSKVDRSRVKSAVKALLAERMTDETPASDIKPHFGHIDLARVEQKLSTHSRVRAVRPMAPAGPWDVLLRADSADAARELLLIGRELAERGFRVAMIDSCGSEVRRMTAFESVHRVTDPLGSARLLISSAGQQVDAAVERHLVVSAEGGPLTSAGASDHVHLRGSWEFVADAAARDVVGWHSRHDRMLAVGAPRDGQARRRRSNIILVLGQPDAEQDGGGRASLQDATGCTDLIFAPSFEADAGFTLPLSVLPVISPHLQAIVIVGDGATPADALAFGIPVFRVGGEVPADAAATVASLDDLSDVLKACKLGEVYVSGDSDPLSAHVERALVLLQP